MSHNRNTEEKQSMASGSAALVPQEGCAREMGLNIYIQILLHFRLAEITLLPLLQGAWSDNDTMFWY